LRADMASVIINIARSNSDAKSLKTGLKLKDNLVDLEDWQDLDFPKFLPISHSRHFPRTTKDQGDRLKPLYRFLDSRVGRPWDDVYSEICQAANVKTLRGWHLLKGHLLSSMVETSVHDVGGGALIGKHSGMYGGRYYVDPQSRLLCKVRNAFSRNNHAWKSELPLAVIHVSDLLQFRKVNGTWMRVRFVKHEPDDIKAVSYTHYGDKVVTRWGDGETLLEEVSREAAGKKDLDKINQILGAELLPYENHQRFRRLIVEVELVRELRDFGSCRLIPHTTYYKLAVDSKFKKLWEAPRKQERYPKNHPGAMHRGFSKVFQGKPTIDKNLKRCYYIG